jgi:hypothetical protein
MKTTTQSPSIQEILEFCDETPTPCLLLDDDGRLYTATKAEKKYSDVKPVSIKKAIKWYLKNDEKSGTTFGSVAYLLEATLPHLRK